jgi:hypothetical protein
MGDIVSDAFPSALYSGNILTTGITNGASIDTTDPVSLISASFLALTYHSGDFALSWEDSDDDINFSPLPDGKTIGSAELSSAVALMVSLPSIGAFGTRRYLRPVITSVVPVPPPESQSLSGITNVGTTATATLAAPYPLTDGDEVTISGANEADYNGTFIISNVVGDDFDYEMLADPAAPATGTLLALCPSDDDRGALITILATRKTEDLDDFRSDTKSYLFGYSGFAADEDKDMGNFDTTTAEGGIGFYLLAAVLTDGVYTLAFDESDDEGVLDPWTEVDPNKVLVGTASVTSSYVVGENLPRTGLFGTKRWIRVRLVATDVTVGVYLVFIFADLASDILPTEAL